MVSFILRRVEELCPGAAGSVSVWTRHALVRDHYIIFAYRNPCCQRALFLAGGGGVVRCFASMRTYKLPGMAAMANKNFVPPARLGSLDEASAIWSVSRIMAQTLPWW